MQTGYLILQDILSPSNPQLAGMTLDMTSDVAKSY